MAKSKIKKKRGRPRKLSAHAWIGQIFKAGQVAQGNVVRRSMHSVAKNASPAQLEAEVRKRGFHMALIGSQYVILCDPNGQQQIVC